MNCIVLYTAFLCMNNGLALFCCIIGLFLLFYQRLNFYNSHEAVTLSIRENAEACLKSIILSSTFDFC